jgi:hypothetical protein
VVSSCHEQPSMGFASLDAAMDRCNLILAVMMPSALPNIAHIHLISPGDTQALLLRINLCGAQLVCSSEPNPNRQRDAEDRRQAEFAPCAFRMAVLSATVATRTAQSNRTPPECRRMFKPQDLHKWYHSVSQRPRTRQTWRLHAESDGGLVPLKEG